MVSICRHLHPRPQKHDAMRFMLSGSDSSTPSTRREKPDRRRYQNAGSVRR
ncbi:hypothetical protein KCP73_17280 [Salmonella enterica subsp. enterica]|nr:hypothetical protein KCP73_17280 [Salmonella enterica subsp. enterica]